MNIHINGQKKESNATTISELVAELGLKMESLIVEHNLQIIQQKNWNSTTIHDGDRIELLSFVGGG